MHLKIVKNACVLEYHNFKKKILKQEEDIKKNSILLKVYKKLNESNGV